MLIEGSASHNHNALVRLGARRHDFNDLAFYAQRVAGTRGAGPGNLAAQARHSARKWKTLDHQTHRRGGRVPPAGCEPAKNAALGSRFVQVKGLRIELRRKRFHANRIHVVRVGSEALPDAQIVQIQRGARFRFLSHRVSPSLTVAQN